MAFNWSVALQMLAVGALAALGFGAMFVATSSDVLLSIVTAIGVIAAAVVVKEVKTNNDSKKV